MKKAVLASIVVALAAFGVVKISTADTMSSTAPAVVIVTPDSIKWMPMEGMNGVVGAVLAGDPKKAGSVYTIRLKLPAGFKVPLHWHDDTERATVLSGTVLFGSGDSVDMAKATTLKAGSFVVIPAKVRHWVESKDESILQVTGTGPENMHTVM